MACEELLDRTEAPARVARTLRAVGAGGLAYAALVLATGSLTSVTGAIVVMLPFAVLGLVVLLTRWRSGGLVLGVLELASALLLAGFNPRKLMLWVLGSIGTGTLAMIWDIHRIEERAAELTAKLGQAPDHK